MARRRRVPEVLWKLYRNRARTLAETIVALFPDVNFSPEICRCKGRRCLMCADTMSLLLRPEDPIDYRKLLNQCFVVVNLNASPLDYFSPDSLWPQRQILERLIETASLKDKQNVLCARYEGNNKSSYILKCLTSSAWEFLHDRVGDDVMIYLLRFTSMFLPLSGKKYHQVAGPPSSLEVIGKYGDEATSHKRKRDNGTLQGRKRQMVFSSRAFAVGAVVGENSDKFDYSSNQKNLKSNSRPFHWFSPTKSRSSDVIPCKTPAHNDSLLKRFQADALSFYPSVSIRSNGFTKIKKQVETKKTDACFTRTYFSVLPRKHVLKTLKANLSGSLSLMKHIFGHSSASVWSETSSGGRGVCLGGSCLFHSLQKSFKILLRRTKASTKLRVLLDKHCPVMSLDQKMVQNSGFAVQGKDLIENARKQFHDSNVKKPRKRVGSADSQPETIRLYCMKSQVISFIWDVCRLIVPSGLLGTASNQRILRRNIAWFIDRRRHEKCSIKQLLHKLKTSNFIAFSGNQFCCLVKECIIPDEAIGTVRHQLCSKWICWLFLEVVKKLVLSNFHVTESQHGKQTLYFYRKCTWEKLTKEAIDRSLDGYIPLDFGEVDAMMREKSRTLSSVRVLPKANGVRMIVNLRSSSKSKFFCNMHAVLKEIQIKEPEKLGSTVSDYNDVYERFSPFLTGLRNESGADLDLFIVVADVSKAFDSIYHNKLLDVMQDVLNDKYSLGMCSIGCSGKGSKWIQDVLFSVDEKTGFTRFTPSNSRHNLIVDRGGSMEICKTDVIFGLKELLEENLVQLNNSFYKQRIGIPQGNKLSSMLCSLYYGHLERNGVYQFLERAYLDGAEDSMASVSCSNAAAPSGRENSKFVFPTYILLRFLDDILFLSTSKNQAATFFRKLRDGFPDYNCFMNKEKFCLNFDVKGESECSSLKRMYVGEDGISFIRWSGLLLNSRTLEVQADYTRYRDNHLNSSLTVSWGGKLVDKLRRKLRSFMMPKCHPILLDSNINSQTVVKLNVYQAFLLAAMKFHCYLSELSRFSKFYPKLLLRLISQSTRYMYRLIRRRMNCLKSSSDISQALKLRKREVVWLGLHAFIQVFSRKLTRYRKLVVSLKSMLFKHKLDEDLSPDMQYAIDKTHSSALWHIKY